MKRVMAFILLVSFLLTPFAAAESAAGEIYLSDLEMKSYTNRNDNWVPGLNRTAYYNTAISVAGRVYSKGICMHPLDEGSGNESECVWDISAYDYDCFKSVIGKDDAGKTGLTDYQLGVYADTKASFFVYFDGVLAYENVVTAGSAEEIEIAVPRGTKEIKLMIGDGGDGIFCDVSDFADARLCNAGEQAAATETPAPTEKATPTAAPGPDNGTYKPDFSKDYVYLSDMNYSDYHAFIGSNGAYIMRDKNVRNESLYTSFYSYDKGLCIHADASTKAYVEFDISGLGYTVFAAYLGIADSKQADTGMASVNFIIYVDGSVAYESGKMVKTDADRLMSVDITGAEKLKIAVDACGSNAGDWGVLGDAVIGKYKTAEEIYSAIGADRPTIAPPTETPVPTAAPTPDNGTYKPDYTRNYVYLSDMNYSDFHAFVGSRGAYIMRDMNVYEEDLFTIYDIYEKGICMHADSSAQAFVEFDIKDLGYTVFAAYLGVADSFAADTSMASLKFIVYVDGAEVYATEKMEQVSENQLVSIDISGASRLKIAIDALGNNSGDWGVLGNAVIGRYKTAEEVFAAIKADRPTSAPTSVPTSTPTSTPAKNPTSDPVSTEVPSSEAPTTVPDSESRDVQEGTKTYKPGIVIAGIALVTVAAVTAAIIIKKNKKGKK